MVQGAASSAHPRKDFKGAFNVVNAITTQIRKTEKSEATKQPLRSLELPKGNQQGPLLRPVLMNFSNPPSPIERGYIYTYQHISTYI